jgi:HAD superfamily hydrolase (TIGR01509 family)
MDGTITRFNLDYMSARRKALEELERLNLRSPEMSEQLSLFLILKKIKEKLDPEAFLRLRKKVYDILEDMEVRAAREVVLYPGAVETIRELRGRGLKIGLVTNNGRVGTEMTLNRYGLGGLFDAVVTRDDSDEMKPEAYPVLKVLEIMHASPEETVLVGDGVIDIMAAKAAGLVAAVAVPTGPFTSTRLIEAEPDYLLGSVNDLPLLIEWLEAKAGGF